MGNRHQSRVLALQFLYQQDLQSNVVRSFEDAFAAFQGMQPEDQPSTAGFAEELSRGTVEHRDEIDARIKAYSENWDFHRITVVDRNILRLAIYEMLFRPDIPPVVSINEAIELAKKFSTFASSVAGESAPSCSGVPKSCGMCGTGKPHSH